MMIFSCSRLMSDDGNTGTTDVGGGRRGGDIRGYFKSDSNNSEQRGPSEESGELEHSTENITTGICANGRTEDANSRIEELYSTFTCTERRLFTDSISKLYKACQTSDGVYFSDVIQCGSEDSASRYCEKLHESFRDWDRSFYFITCHGTHIHVIHDCPYSNQSCRCKWRKETEKEPSVDLRRPLKRGRRRKPIRRFTRSELEDLQLYMSTHGREIKYSSLFRQVEGLQGICKSLSEKRSPRFKVCGSEGQCFSQSTDELQRELCYPEVDKEIRGRDSTLPSTEKGSRKRKRYDVFSEAQKFLEMNPTSPISNFVKHVKYLNDEFLSRYRGDNPIIKNVIDVFHNKILSWTCQDFFSFYTKPGCKPVFAAIHDNFDDIYYDIEDSLNILNELVAYQCNYDDDKILEFVTCFYNILEKVIPKLNCMVFWGPPNSGKNFFCDGFFDFYGSKGQLGRANKHNNFAFANAANKRVIVGDEFSYESSETDQLKMMFGGTQYTVRVKCKEDEACYRQPFFIMTNKALNFMYDPAFETRIKVVEWKEAPQLKDMKKKPHPLACYYFFVQYGLIKMKTHREQG